jgi:hypothetical protein
MPFAATSTKRESPHQFATYASGWGNRPPRLFSTISKISKNLALLNCEKVCLDRFGCCGLGPIREQDQAMLIQLAIMGRTLAPASQAAARLITASSWQPAAASRLPLGFWRNTRICSP